MHQRELAPAKLRQPLGALELREAKARIVSSSVESRLRPLVRRGAREARIEERVERRRDVGVGIGGRLECLERRAAGKDREHGEHVSGRRVEQLHAPVDGRPQRALPLGEVRRRPGEERERVSEPLRRALDPEHAHARGGELDREREAVERPA